MTRDTTFEEFMEVMQKLFKNFIASKGYSQKDIGRMLGEYKLNQETARKKRIAELEAELKALKGDL